MTNQARGVRNNNPGNIDFNPANKWQGQLGLELDVVMPRFARFDSPENGIRALAKLLLNYRGKPGTPGVGKEGIDTVRETISRWAPGNENNTEAYIKQVCKAMSVTAEAPIDVKDYETLLSLTTAIIIHENGGNPYAPAIVAEGVKRALA